MESIIIIILILVFVYITELQRSKAEEKRLTQFISSLIKEENKEQDLGSLPKQEEVQEQNEFIELEEVDPDQLIKHLHGDNEN